jgi:hypothetical protein
VVAVSLVEAYLEFGGLLLPQVCDMCYVV